MLCPICNGNTHVRSTVCPSGNEHAVMRRRECEKCGHRYTTFEVSEQEWKRWRELEKAARALSEQLG